MNKQTTVNTDSIENLVAKGVVENVQDKNSEADKVEQDIQQHE